MTDQPAEGVRGVMQTLLADHRPNLDPADQAHVSGSTAARLTPRQYSTAVRRLTRLAAEADVVYCRLDDEPADGWETGPKSDGRSPKLPGSHVEAGRAAHHDLCARRMSSAVHEAADVLAAALRPLDHLRDQQPPHRHRQVRQQRVCRPDLQQPQVRRRLLLRAVPPASSEATTTTKRTGRPMNEDIENASRRFEAAAKAHHEANVAKQQAERALIAAAQELARAEASLRFFRSQHLSEALAAHRR